MPEIRLQPSIANDTRSKALLRLSQRLGQPGQDAQSNVSPGVLDVTPLLVYHVDTVPESALPYLAWQFDLLSAFWQLLAPASATGTAAQREMISLAVALHRRRGTPSAIRDALIGVRWGTVSDPPVIYEGQDSWGGTAWPADEGWAVYRVRLPAIDWLDGQPEDLTWRDYIAYEPGDLVTYKGATGAYYICALAPPVGVPPYYDSIDLIPSMAYIADMATLRTVFWAAAPLDGQGVPYRVVTDSDVGLIRAACEFFQPARCLLDTIISVKPPIEDTMLPWSDVVGTDVDITDEMLPWSDFVCSFLSDLAETMECVPDHSGGYGRGGIGITYAKTAVGMVDAVITLDGIGRES
jgi:hypothetical protein